MSEIRRLIRFRDIKAICRNRGSFAGDKVFGNYYCLALPTDKRVNKICRMKVCPVWEKLACVDGR